MTGLGLRLVAYEVWGDRLGILPDTLDFTWVAPLGDMPTLTVTYPEWGRKYDLLEGHVELAVEVYVPDADAWAEVPSGRFHVIKRSWNRTDETHVRKYDAQGVQWVTRRARVWDHAGQMDADGKRQFLSATPGEIIGTIFTEAQTRGWAPGAARAFSDVADSQGHAWAKVVTIAYDPGLDLDSVIGNLRDQGVIDYMWVGRNLFVYNPDAYLAPDLTTGTDPTWLRDTSVTSAPEASTIEDLVTFARVQGDAGLTWEVDNPVALQVYGRLEAYITQGGVSDEGTALTLADAQLRGGEAEKFQYTREIHTELGRPWPIIDYPVGAWIFASTDEGRERLRIVQVSLTRNASGVSGHVTLGTRLDDLLARLAKRTKGIVGGSTSSGGSGASPNPPGDDKRVPAAPTGFVASSSAYIDPNGNARGLVVGSWVAVDHASDGTILDSVDRYEIWGRQAVAGVPWSKITDVEGTDFSWSPFPVGEEWQFRVRAVAEPGYRAGAFSGVVQITIEDDVTPPPVPSAPVLASRLGAVTVTWDGLNKDGGGMPADFDRCDVWQGTPATDATVLLSETDTNAAAQSAVVGVAQELIIHGLHASAPTSWPAAALCLATGAVGVTFGADGHLTLVVTGSGGSTRYIAVPFSSWLTGTVDLTVRYVGGQVQVDDGTNQGFWNTTDLEEGGFGTAAFMYGGAAEPLGYTYDLMTIGQPATIGDQQVIGSVRLSGGSDFIVVTDLPYGEDTTFSLTAVDHTGNSSDFSDPATIAVTPLVNTDLIGEVVDDANIVNVDGTKINPGSIETARLQVGSENLIVDPTFLDQTIRDARASRTGVSFAQVGGEQEANLSAAATTTLILGTESPLNVGNGVPWIDVEPGGQYQWVAYAANDGTGDTDLRAYYGLLRADGTTTFGTSPVAGTLVNGTAFVEYRWNMTIPSDGVRIAPGFRRVGAAGGVVRLRQVGLRRRVGGVLIEDGAITAPKIAALAIEAGKIAANAVTADKINAGAVTAVKVAANAITTTQLAATAITAKHTITGATIQTDTPGNNPRVFMNVNGLFMYDEDGDLAFSASTSTGTVAITGDFQTNKEARSVKISATLQTGRPGARFDTGLSYQTEPQIFSEDGTSPSGPNDGQPWPAGTLVLTSAETTTNNTGRADLALKRTGDFQLRSNWGTYAGIGLTKEGYKLGVRGHVPYTDSAGGVYNFQDQMIVSAFTRLVGSSGAITVGAPPPTGAGYPFAQIIASYSAFVGIVTPIVASIAAGSFTLGVKSSSASDNAKDSTVQILRVWARKVT